MTCVLGEGQNISCSMADGILEFYIRYIERGYDPLAPHIDRGFSPHIDRGYERVSDGGIDRGFNPRIYRGLERGHERGSEIDYKKSDIFTSSTDPLQSIGKIYTKVIVL